MDKTVRSLVRLSVALRNLSTLRSCSMSKRYLRTVPLYCHSSTNNNDLSNAPPTSNTNKRDILFNSLRYSKESEEIFDMIAQNKSNMKSGHIMRALRSLFLVQKTGTNSINPADIRERPDFALLCELLKMNVRSLEINEAIEALKVVSYFGVPSTSVLVQSLLQIVRHSINQLSLHHIIFLDFIMQNFESTPLVEALNIALPIIFENQLHYKLVRENVVHLSEVLQYLAKKSDDKDAIGLVIEALINRGQDMDIRSAANIVWALCELRHLPPGYSKVLFNAQEVLSDCIAQLPYRDIEAILVKVTSKIIHRHPEFYHEVFMDACARAVISEDHGFEEAIYISKRLTRVGHTQIRLLDYLAAKCFENPTLLMQCPPPLMVDLVASLATADYKPIFWESMQLAVVDNKVLEKGKQDLPWIKFAVDLASLDCYCPKLLEKVFKEDFVRQISSKEEQLLLLLLYQSVRTLYPTYEGPWPSQNILESAMHFNGKFVDEFPLLPALEKSMGGPQYVQTSLRTKLGHFVDHVVVMRKGGYPVAMNSVKLKEANQKDSPVYIEDLQIPPESQIISIMNLPPNAYAVNSQRLKGTWALLLKSLEAQFEHAVIPIRSTMWNGLPDHEKIPYLMQAIRLKCDDRSESANLR